VEHEQRWDQDGQAGERQADECDGGAGGVCLRSDHLVAGEYGYWEVEQHENTHEVSVGMRVKMCRRVRDVHDM
jgi:hypothetical protein